MVSLELSVPRIICRSVSRLMEYALPKPKKTFPLWIALLLLLVGQPLLAAAGYLVGANFFWVDRDLVRLQRQLAHFQQMVVKEPENIDHRTELGFTYYTLGDYRGALDHLEQAIKMDETYLPAYLSRGFVYVALGRLDEALRDFEQAKELSPEDFRGHLNSGIVFREMGMFEESIADLERARTLHPRGSDIYYHLALTYEQMGEAQAALELLGRSLELDPQNALALAALARLQNR